MDFIKDLKEFARKEKDRDERLLTNILDSLHNSLINPNPYEVTIPVKKLSKNVYTKLKAAEKQGLLRLKEEAGDLYIDYVFQ